MGTRSATAWLALAGLSLTSTALADVQGQATLGNLRVTLFDLDLSDAITPSITFSLPDAGTYYYERGSLSMSYWGYASDYSFNESYDKSVRMSPGKPETLGFSSGSHAEIGATYSHSSPLGQSMSLSARLGADQQHYYGISASAQSNTMNLTVSPNTAAVFSMDLAFAGTTSALPSHSQYLYLNASMYTVDVNGYLYAGDDTAMRIGSSAYDVLSMDDSDILSVAFSNTGDTERAGSLNFSMSLSAGLQPVSAVPEPSGYAMLLAGAALFGWRATGRRPTHRMRSLTAA